MMFPNNKQALIDHQGSLKKIARPELAEEQQHEMLCLLKVSGSEYIHVTITLYGEYGNQEYTGIVTGLDPRLFLVKLQLGYDWKLFEFTDIIGVRLLC
ncbi:YolD-like family protein [Neobacillus pocheonensis]|uniref:YolD-like family protein n=1 Tax=Neobacillus pocheonensis TaxID=363869 RepID=UPI003D26DDCE